MRYKALRYTYLAVVLLGCIILATSYFISLGFIYNEKRIFQLGVLVAGACIFLFTPQIFFDKTFIPKKEYFFWAGIGAVGLCIISALMAVFPFYALVEVSLYLLLFLLIVFIASSLQQYSQVVWAVFGAAVLFVFFYAIKFGIGYSFHLDGYKDFPLWPGSGFEYALTGFSNIRFFNQVQAFTLPLLVGSTVYAVQKKRVGYFVLFLSVFWWMLLIQSAGRGIILSTLISGLLVLLLFKENAHRWLWYFVGTLAVAFIAKLVLFNVLPEVGSAKSIMRGGSSRLTLWPKVFWDTLEQPILGHGPMSFANVNNSYFRGHPHNSVLQLLYEFGYPATLLLISGVFYGIWRWIVQTQERLKKPAEKHADIIIRISLTAALFSGLLYSLFSGVIVMPLSQLWLAITAGSMVGIYYQGLNTEKINCPKKSQTYALKFVVLLAAGMLVAVLVKDVPTLKENEQEYVRETSSKTLHPRFWQQGIIGIDHSGMETKTQKKESSS